ncbi:hypothetical protein CHARACLAT_028984, partial [Characodon lateralis]|nr:hypothetical protein [Characodon lateralis]
MRIFGLYSLFIRFQRCFDELQTGTRADCTTGRKPRPPESLAHRTPVTCLLRLFLLFQAESSVLRHNGYISLFQVSSLTGHADERLTGSQSVASFFYIMSCSLTLLVLILLIPPSSLQVVALWRRGNRVSSINACQQSEAADGGLTVRCSGLRLTQIPIGLSNYTTHLFLNNNRLSSLPAFCFSDLFLLDELDLSHNQLSSLEPGCFSGLAPSLQYLDLSSNRLTTLDPAVVGGLQVQANLSQNPWHCDCSMQ